MFVKKVLMIVLVSVIYLINLNIPVAAEENEQDIIFSPNWMLENGYKEEVEENQGKDRKSKGCQPSQLAVALNGIHASSPKFVGNNNSHGTGNAERKGIHEI